MEIFTANEVTSITGLELQAVDHLVRSGVVTPSIRSADGRGSRRLYSRTDVIAVGVAAELRRLGSGSDLIRRVASFLQREGGTCGVEEGGQWVVVADTSGVQLVREDAIHSMWGDRRSALIVPLSGVLGELERQEDL